MARVNVEHKALTDSRFEMLGTLLGSNRYEALGRMLLVWHECQDRGSYILPEKLVGIIMGSAKGAEFLIDSDLAERVEGGVRIKGTEGRIEWLQQKRESGHQHGPRGAKHGKKGGRPPKQNGVETGSEPGDPVLKPGDRVSETGSKPGGNPPPPLAPPPALPLEEDKSQRQKSAAKPPAAKPPRREPEGVHHEFVRVFTDAWFAKYGKAYPFAGGKDGTHISNLRAYCQDNLGMFREAVLHFFRDDSKFTIDARHSLGLLYAQWVRHSTGPPPGVLPILPGGNVMDSFRETAGEFLRRHENDAA